MAFATAQGLEYRVAHGRLLLGWALARQGDTATGATQHRQRLAVQDFVYCTKPGQHSVYG
jgi:hypothetical protein